MLDTKEIVSDLNELLEKNYDAVKGYRKAAEDVESSQLKQFFAQQASERSQFGQQIHQIITGLGGEPVEDGSFLGDVHRKWMDLKAALSSNEEESIIEASLTGEKAALDDYEDILDEEEIPANLRTLLTEQKEKVNQAIIRLKNLEDYYD